MREMHGKAVTERQVDDWVAEAEAGYDVGALRKRGRPGRGAEPSRVIPVRLTEEELAAVMAKADREHLNRSEAIRRALSAWASVA